jgi:hypothetical protein
MRRVLFFLAAVGCHAPAATGAPPAGVTGGVVQPPAVTGAPPAGVTGGVVQPPAVSQAPHVPAATGMPPAHATGGVPSIMCVFTASHLGDAVCDTGTEANTAACNWDGGDCCVSTCKSTTSAECLPVDFFCLDPDASTVVAPPSGATGAPLLTGGVVQPPAVRQAPHVPAVTGAPPAGWTGGVVQPPAVSQAPHVPAVTGAPPAGVTGAVVQPPAASQAPSTGSCMCQGQTCTDLASKTG